MPADDAGLVPQLDAEMPGGVDSGMPGSRDAGATAGGMDASSLDAQPAMEAGGSSDAARDAARDAALQPPDSGTADASDGATPAIDAGSCVTTQVADYCAELPHLPVAPLIDGRLECNLALHDVTPVAWTNTTSPIPAGHSARLAAAWREDGVYFFIEVTDATRLPRPSGTDVWCGDGTELYIDSDGSFAAAPMYDAPGAIQLLAMAPADDTTSVNTGGQRYRSPNGGMLVGPWSSPRYGAFPKPGGYVFEAFIQADDLDLTSWTLASGSSVGLDIAINVSVSSDPPPSGETPGCGLRLGQYFLRVDPAPCTTNCFPFSTSAAFCAPVLRD